MIPPPPKETSGTFDALKDLEGNAEFLLNLFQRLAAGFTTPSKHGGDGGFVLLRHRLATDGWRRIWRPAYCGAGLRDEWE